MYYSRESVYIQVKCKASSNKWMKGVYRFYARRVGARLPCALVVSAVKLDAVTVERNRIDKMNLKNHTGNMVGPARKCA